LIAESEGASVDEAVESFLDRRDEAFARLRRFMRGLAMEGVNDLAQLTVALRQIRALVG
jgi:NAD-specific glutamate dehydrogenase